MIAPRQEEQALQVISIGLQSEEQTGLAEIISDLGGELRTALDDLELWSHARYGRFDLCVLGQSKEITDPSYLIWLLKGIANQSRIILIYSTLAPEEAERLKRYHAIYVLQRPIDPDRLAHTIETALNRSSESGLGFWSRISNLIHIHHR